MDNYNIGRAEYIALREECADLDQTSHRFQNIQQMIIDSGNGLFIYDFVDKYADKVDLEKMENTLIALKDWKHLDMFVKQFDTVDTKRIARLFMKFGEAKYLKNLSANQRLQIDRLFIYNWMIKNNHRKYANNIKLDIAIAKLEELNEHYNNFGKDVEYNKAYIAMLKSKNAKYVYEFATRVGGFDYKQVALKLYELGDAKYIAKFLTSYVSMFNFESNKDKNLFNKLRDKVKLSGDLDAICDMANGLSDMGTYDLEDIILSCNDSRILHLYASTAGQGYLEEFAYRIIRLGDPKYMYMFMRDVETDVSEALLEEIVASDNAVYSGLASNIEDADVEYIEDELIREGNAKNIYEFTIISKTCNKSKMFQELAVIGNSEYLEKYEQFMKIKEMIALPNKQVNQEIKRIGGVIKGGKRIVNNENKLKEEVAPNESNLIMGVSEEDFNKEVFGIREVAKNEYKKNGRSKKFVEYEDEVLSSSNSTEMLQFVYGVEGCDLVRFEQALIKLGDAEGIYNLIFMTDRGANADNLRQALVDLKADEWVKKFDNKLKELDNKRGFNK